MKLRVQILKTLNIALIHFQPMFCFPTPENIRKPLFFFVFRVYRSRALVEFNEMVLNPKKSEYMCPDSRRTSHGDFK